MDALTKDDVAAIAELARLSLSDDECDAMAAQLTDVLESFAELAELDTGGIEPMTHAVPLSLRLRPDTVESSLPVEQAVGAAPDSENGLFRVPPIIARPKR